MSPEPKIVVFVWFDPEIVENLRNWRDDERGGVKTRDGRFCSKVGQFGPKWDKSGAFSDQISVHLAPPRQMH